MTQDEFQQHFALKANEQDLNKALPKFDPSPVAEDARRALMEQVGLPDYVDWRAQGAVTPIKVR